MEAPIQQRYSFGPFALDPVEKLLLRNGHPVTLPPKALETLLVLVEHRGHTMEKRELLECVWPNTFVEEATLTQNIFTLRKALGDSPDGHEYIETVPKRGYRFVAPVKLLEQQPQAPERMQTVFSRALASRPLLWAVAGILVVVIALGVYLRERSRTSAAALRTGKVTLAVLPFVNLSGDPGQEYFSDGLTEEMIAQLSRLNPEQLRVIARTSSMQYKGTAKSVAQIGRELGVNYILESSVRREGDRARITTQLVRVGDQTHLWSQSYDREVREILPLESEVARAVAEEIEVKLSSQEQARLVSPHSVAPEAYQLYLQGRYLLNQVTPDSERNAVQLFEKAIQLDSNYAPSYSGLADSYGYLDALLETPSGEIVPKLKQAAEKAVALDDTLAEAHASLAYSFAREWNWALEEKELRRATDLNPSYSLARMEHGHFLMLMGRTEEALSEFKLAREADPVSPVINLGLGWGYLFTRQCDLGIQQAKIVLQLNASISDAHELLAACYELMGEKKKGFAERLQVMRLRGDNHLADELQLIANSSSPRLAHQWLGKKKLEYFLEKSRSQYISPFEIAAIYAGDLHDYDQAMVWLEKGYREHVFRVAWIKVDVDFDGMRTKPQFQDLLRRIGLPP